MISPEDAKEKVNSGWFDVWLAFEGLAIKPEVVKSALEGLTQRLDTDEKVKLYHKEFLEAKKIEKPLKGIEEAWSQVANVKIISKSFANLIQMIIEYGPSSIEVVSPSKSELPVSDAQDILNNVAGMMHRFAAAGVGGAVVVQGK